VKRSFLFFDRRQARLVASSAGLIAATYGLVRLAFGLFLPDVRADLSFDAATAGLISSGASLVYCAAALVGFLAASRHPRRLVIGAALTAGLGAAGMAASGSAALFAAFAVLSSAGAGLASPALVRIVSRNSPTEATDPAQAMVNAGTGPGLVAAGALALALLPDWRLAWALGAAFTVVVAALVLLFDRGDPFDRGDAEPETRAGTRERMLPPGSWFRAHGLVLTAALLMGAGSAATWTYGRTLLVDAGASSTLSVTAWIALGLGGTAVVITTRWTSALRPRTTWVLTVGASALASAALGALPSTDAVTLAACVVFGWGYTAGSGALISWTSEIDARRAPAGTSLLFVTLILGQALGATVFGLLIATAGFAAAFLAAAVVTAVAAALPALRRPGGSEQRVAADTVRRAAAERA
jgi:predicted MFS family arabinose efflux permease